jgi:hypothetical protein
MALPYRKRSQTLSPYDVRMIEILSLCRVKEKVPLDKSSHQEMHFVTNQGYRTCKCHRRVLPNLGNTPSRQVRIFKGAESRKYDKMRCCSLCVKISRSRKRWQKHDHLLTNNSPITIAIISVTANVYFLLYVVSKSSSTINNYLLMNGIHKMISIRKLTKKLTFFLQKKAKKTKPTLLSQAVGNLTVDNNDQQPAKSYRKSVKNGCGKLRKCKRVG